MKNEWAKPFLESLNKSVMEESQEKPSVPRKEITYPTVKQRPSIKVIGEFVLGIIMLPFGLYLLWIIVPGIFFSWWPVALLAIITLLVGAGITAILKEIDK